MILFALFYIEVLVPLILSIRFYNLCCFDMNLEIICMRVWCTLDCMNLKSSLFDFS